MTTAARLLAFTLLVGLAGVLGWVAGDAAGPTPPTSTVPHDGGAHSVRDGIAP